MARPDEDSGRVLPRGRHHLTREQVEASQRRRLLDGMVAAVGASGYADVTVADVLARAKVSRATFYEHFRDKDDCFLQAARDVQDEFFRQVLGAGSPAQGWLEGLRAGTRAAIRYWTEHPDAARLFLLEVPSAGDRARAAREELHARFMAMFHEVLRRACDEDNTRTDRPPVVMSAVVYAVLDLTSEHVRQRREAHVDALEERLLYVQLMGLADHKTAAEATRPELVGQLPHEASSRRGGPA